MTKQFAFILVLWALLCGAPSAWAGETITLTTGEWPPYFSKEFLHGGFVTRVVTESFALANMEARYEYLPWKRGFEAARLGQYAGAMGWIKTPDRERDFLFSDPILTYKAVFFHRMGKQFHWEGLGDVGHMTVGVTLGYTYANMLKATLEARGGSLATAPTDLINFQKLAAGRIDVFPCALAVGNYLLKTRFPPETRATIHSHPRPLHEGKLYLLISKKYPDGKAIIARFNTGLRRLRASGLYRQYENESSAGEYIPKQ
ncbi:substrate-binding periplasmic protein [Pseudodesulfovibrio piezophilus]|uniref:Putative Extracellular solute-binding protein, family 3 n=1 Tax=Pseudodesulfovibrio piezophilus (strain DSM 21447 / JCM 15486 / C1TLV30) TaxID=1322246 RepID=M1WM44_PSEP2|nr:transporter substrate-binding domain-containing protein [Pseudodesulfovibrio piezophilus]CCH48960.1 putative Extracellular solute-binding protein, family 3 [Pseudodesulfovibrio piezophilus C1TLV30]